TVSDRSFSYGDPDAAFAAAELVVEERFRFPRWAGNPLECYGVVCDWNQAEGSLTAWANFQGPFTLHAVAAGALGLPGSKLRLITPPDSGGSFGTKAAVYAYVVLLGVVSKQLGVPVRWTEDRLEHLAASASAPRATGSCSRTARRPASTAASAGRSSTSRSSGRSRSRRGGSISIRSTSAV